MTYRNLSSICRELAKRSYGHGSSIMKLERFERMRDAS